MIWISVSGAWLPPTSVWARWRAANQTLANETLTGPKSPVEDSMLTDLEAVFRGLQSELGSRPVYHHTADRTEGHLFIMVLAYQLVQAIRRELEAAGETTSWTRSREILSVQRRITAVFRQRDGHNACPPGHGRRTGLAPDLRRAGDRGISGRHPEIHGLNPYGAVIVPHEPERVV
jgi:hypothetical protein